MSVLCLCSYYQLLVHRVKDWSDTISDWKNFGPDFYITAQIPAATVNPSKVFVVGDGKSYYGYDNKRLLSGQKYMIHARGLSPMTKVYSGFSTLVLHLIIYVFL